MEPQSWFELVFNVFVGKQCYHRDKLLLLVLTFSHESATLEGLYLKQIVYKPRNTQDKDYRASLTMFRCIHTYQSGQVRKLDSMFVFVALYWPLSNPSFYGIWLIQQIFPNQPQNTSNVATCAIVIKYGLHEKTTLATTSSHKYPCNICNIPHLHYFLTWLNILCLRNFYCPITWINVRNVSLFLLQTMQYLYL